MDRLTIDGSYGEGGGQVLRSSLALSMITGTPFCIERIRAGRKKPGLMQQHLTSVRAATEVCGGRVEGAALGSTAISFEPGPIRPGSYSFTVGTAGSATLVLQTVLPALLTASGSSSITLEGGTHNPFAPPYDFLERAFLPLISRMGPAVSADLTRPGFYPAGGGMVAIRVTPAPQLARLELTERGPILHEHATAWIANLPRHVADRELLRIGSATRWKKADLHVCERPDARGPGNAVVIDVESANVTEVFTGFGQRGVKAEQVAARVLAARQRYVDADVPIGEHLADQLMLPMAIGSGGVVRTLEPTLHTRTNIEVIRRFLGLRIGVERDDDAGWIIRVDT